MNLQPYPHYKPTNIPWLSALPEHWELRRLKHWVGINESTLSETTAPDFEFRYLEISVVDNGELIEEPKRIRSSSASSRAKRIVRKGGTIIATVRTYLKAV